MRGGSRIGNGVAGPRAGRRGTRLLLPGSPAAAGLSAHGSPPEGRTGHARKAGAPRVGQAQGDRPAGQVPRPPAWRSGRPQPAAGQPLASTLQPQARRGGRVDGEDGASGLRWRKEALAPIRVRGGRSRASPCSRVRLWPLGHCPGTQARVRDRHPYGRRRDGPKGRRGSGTARARPCKGRRRKTRSRSRSQRRACLTSPLPAPSGRATGLGGVLWGTGTKDERTTRRAFDEGRWGCNAGRRRCGA